MNRRQKAIEIVNKNIVYGNSILQIEKTVDALLASDFCSDSVAELVKKLESDARGTLGLLNQIERELLRSIVSEE